MPAARGFPYPAGRLTAPGWLLAAGLAALLPWTTGCGQQKRTTPEACLSAFDAAMRAGNGDKAASLFALDRVAADNNSDWDAAAPSQRKLIVDRMREQKAAELATWRDGYRQQDYKPSTPQESGEWASASLVGASDTRAVRLCLSKGEWCVYSVGGQPTVPGP